MELTNRLILLLILCCTYGIRGFVLSPSSIIPSPSLSSRSSSITTGTSNRVHTTNIIRCNAILPRGPFGWAAPLLLVASSVRIVKEGEVSIVERLGRFHKVITPGIHATIPLADRIRLTVSTREQIFDIPPQKCITSDNAPLSADAVVYWRIFDPEKAVYSVVDLELAIQNLVLTQLRSEIGKLTLDMTFSAREQINSVLLKDLDVATDPWGVKITRVEVRDIIPNNEIMRAMEMQMAAERTKRATVIRSQGERERAVNEAEGQAQSCVIDARASAEALILEAKARASSLEVEAKGAANALQSIAKSFDSEGSGGGTSQRSIEAARFHLASEYVKAQLALASSENSKVIFAPDSANSLLVQAMAFYDDKPDQSLS